LFGAEFFSATQKPPDERIFPIHLCLLYIELMAKSSLK
jgi:hypothetical protein